MMLSVRYTLLVYGLTLAALVFGLQASAQQEFRIKKKNIFEVGLGLSTLGPTRQMVDLMKQNELDGREWTFWNIKQYPRFLWLGSEIHLAFLTTVTEKGHLGISFASLERGSVKGYSNAHGGLLWITFSQASITLVYRHQLEKGFALEAGPAIVFNDATTNSNKDDSQDYTSVSPGLKCALILNILKWRQSNLQADLQFVFSGWPEMGPFTAFGDPGSTTIQKSALSYNFLTFGMRWSLPF